MVDFKFLMSALGVFGGVITVITIIWKYIFKPNLSEQFITRAKCVENHKRTDSTDQSLSDSVDQLKVDVGALKITSHESITHLNWIRESLGRLENGK
jgi:hypothetical protein